MLWLNEWPALRSFGKSIFLKYMLPKASQEKIYASWLNVLKKLLSFEKKINLEYLQTLSNEELSKQWNNFHDLLKQFWVFTIPAELGNYGAPDLLQEELKQYIQDEKELIVAMEVLTAPEKFSFYQQEEIDLVKTKDFKKHQQRYVWLKNSYAGVQVLDVDFFKERQKKLSPYIEKELLVNLNETIQRKKDLARKRNLPATIVWLARVISQNVAWQDDRKKYIFKNLYIKHIFLQETENRFSYEYEDLLNCWYTDIADIIKGKNLRKMLLDRRKGFGIYFDSTIKIISTFETLRYWEHYAEEKVEAVNQFAGIVACAGKGKLAKGKIRILLDPYDLDSFKEGEILVAPMTSPEYIFAMKRAKAIITDTGGLTSHAAIVSRELKIPCLVGTKIATRVLRDGDVVKVDVTKGVVKIVSQIPRS
jgi:phosphohistidine swiveling domain-containing protein